MRLGTSLSVLVRTSGIKRLSLGCDGGGIKVILVIVVLSKWWARACQSLLLRFSQNMLWLCRLISLVSISCRVVLRRGLSSSLIQAHPPSMGVMSLDGWQGGSLHCFERIGCRLLASVLSLSSVKGGWIRQHYECSKSPEKSSLTVMQ